MFQLNGDESCKVVDWMHASLGNPAADVAEVYVMIEYAVLSPERPAAFIAFFEASRKAAYKTCFYDSRPSRHSLNLNAYFALEGLISL